MKSWAPAASKSSPACSPSPSPTSAAAVCCSPATAWARSRCTWRTTGAGSASLRQLKGLLAAGLVAPEVDLEALDLYLAYGYVPAPWTIFRGAAKLPAGHLAVCDGGGMRIERYWDLDFSQTSTASEEDLTEELQHLLGEAVRDRLESEVPLGAFLSGGIDSGTVVALMGKDLAQPVRTHTVGFADRATDERADAAAVARALGTDHVATEVRPDLAEVLPRIAWHLDEPFADPSAVPTWYVSRETRRRVTVALSGDGGDELFAGYGDRYRMHLLEERARGWLPGGLRRAVLPGSPASGRARRTCRVRSAPAASSPTWRWTPTVPISTTAV